MSSFLLPNWVIKRIDRIRRGFLWGHHEGKRGISLINWQEVCTPKQFGGMGGANLEKRNWALLLRWWWKLYRQQQSLWAQTITTIKSVTAARYTHRVWMLTGSFFWIQLLKLRPLFNWSTTWIINSGASIAYWFDNWTTPIMASLIAPLAENRTWSLQMAEQRGLPCFNLLHTATSDCLQWKWTGNNIYSASSFYNMVLTGGRTLWAFRFIWKLNIPPTVKIFSYLCLKGRLLAHEVMMQRGIHCDLRCPLCQRCPLETADHLLFHCDYAAVVWNRITIRLGYTIMRKGPTV